MTTLTTPPLATVLTQLFQDARATSDALAQRIASVPAEERARLMTSAHGLPGDV
jgi:protoheme ferro-lyase